MKILMVNKFFYIKGGSETYYFALKKLLKSKGHTVIDFSMKDSKNFKSLYEDFFVENVDYNAPSSIVGKIQSAMKIIYSTEAKKNFEKLVLETNPDLIHLHIFQHQLSPSILSVIKKYNIPTVYTAHDLKMVCLNYKMMHHNTICEECKNGKYINCLKNKCVKGSAVKSLINVIEGYFHKQKKSYNVIDAIVTPSDFYKKKFIDFGVEEKKIYHIPNFTNIETQTVEKNDDCEKYYLYFGRLSEEKGVLTLVKAFEKTDLSLYIVGTGPLKESLEKYVQKNNLKKIRMLGFKSGKELINLVGNSKAVILPSEWYENGPYSAIESLQLSRPIIGADIGGIPELINNNGYLFKSGNSQELRNVILKLESLSNNEYENMKKASKDLFDKTYTKEVHFDILNKVYKKVVVRI